MMSKQVKFANIALRMLFLVSCGGLMFVAGHTPWRIGLNLIAWWALFAVFDGARERSRARRNRPLDFSLEIEDFFRFERSDWLRIGVSHAFVIATGVVLLAEPPR